MMPPTTPPARAGARGIPCVPPPEGWEAAGDAAEEGTAAAVTLNEEPGGPYFDASDTLPLPADELIIAGALIPKARSCRQRPSRAPPSFFGSRPLRCGIGLLLVAHVGLRCRIP